MWTLLISVGCGALVGGTLRAVGLVHSFAGALLPGFLIALVSAIFLFRRVSLLIGPVVEKAQGHLQGGRRELALSSLRDGLRLGRWHPLLEGQLRTQIGALLYDQGDLDDAIVELSRASKTPWESRAFLACAYFKKRDEAGMTKALEEGVKAGEKDDLFWSLYAWCLNAVGKKDEALKVLKRGLDKLPNNQRLLNHVESIGEGKKLKVAQYYGDKWARFSLDGSVATGGMKIPKAMRGYAQRPGFRNKPQRKR